MFQKIRYWWDFEMPYYAERVFCWFLFDVAPYIVALLLIIAAFVVLPIPLALLLLFFLAFIFFIGSVSVGPSDHW